MKPIFAARCGLESSARAAQAQAVLQRCRQEGIDTVRVAWCDLHGLMRGKALSLRALERAFDDGVGLVSTLLLKDTSDRTAYKVFEPGGTRSLPGFGQANNLVALPAPDSFVVLPWLEHTGWLRCDLWFAHAEPVPLDARRVLQSALARLQDAGLQMRVGLEVEFHIYRLRDVQAQLDPARADWPGPAPDVAMLHPGFGLLSETWLDMAEPALRIVRDVATALDMPLLSLEAEMGPSQVEAVFDVSDALRAADQLAHFRVAVRQALRRAGYHATFMCRPPFANVMSSGWHLHQSLVDPHTGANRLRRDAPAPGATPADAAWTLSELGEHYLAGLLAHARGTALFCTPTANGYGRFRPHALAPQRVLWGRDNRGAMLRVLGECGDAGTRIENRLGESGANPYLYFASQIAAGLDGVTQRLRPPPATDDPYGDASAEHIPTRLGDAIDAALADTAVVRAFGADFMAYYAQIKRSEARRFDEASDVDEFQRREYFARY